MDVRKGDMQQAVKADEGYGVYSVFNIEKHKETFIHYLEVTVFPDGHVEYAVPSHQQHLEKIAMRKLNIYHEKVLRDLCPKDMWGAYTEWLCDLTGCAAVWENYVVLPGLCSVELLATLDELRSAGLLGVSKNEIAAMQAARALRDALHSKITIMEGNDVCS